MKYSENIGAGSISTEEPPICSEVFTSVIEEALTNGEKLDLAKIRKIADKCHLTDEKVMMQACELGVVLAARYIVKKNRSLRETYSSLLELYENQPTIHAVYPVPAPPVLY